MFIPEPYWSNVVIKTIGQIAEHINQGLCIRPKPNQMPLNLCVRKSTEGSMCCSLHKEQCPTKK